ncbi:MAG: ABC transporter ATP-binding protein [Bacteroidota bacterium]
MIQLQNIHFHYKKKTPLFKALDLTIPKGNIYGLLGKNGAGKSSLLKLIGGLLFPKSGDISVLGFQPSERFPAFLSDLFFIPEDLHIPAMKIATFEKIYAPFYPKFDSTQFQQYLSEFKVPTDSKLNQLSQGQKKKAMISFGLATNASLLILDEPTNGLDIPSKSLFRKVLTRAISDEQICIISTHQVRDMGNLIDPVIILDEGQIVFNDYVENIAQKLHFEVTYGRGNPDEVLYAERVPSGYMIVKENGEDEETEVDIEAFFNTVMTNRAEIERIFS